MMLAERLLVTACLAPVCGVIALRVAWAQATRTATLNLTGWTLLLCGALIGGSAAGAWGVSVSALCGMTAACLALAWAGLRAPPGRRRAPSRGVGMAPPAGEPLRIGERLMTFALVAFAATAVALALTVAARGLARAAGLGDADANALALMGLPLAWALVAFLVLMQERRRGQVLVLLGTALPALVVLAPGLVA